MVRVEVRNVGSERIFVPSEIGRGFSKVQFWWEESEGKGLLGIANSVDRIGPPHEDFLKLLVENWVVLPPGYSYENSVDASSNVAELPKPGRYRIRAKYVAYDMNSTSLNNPRGAYLDRISSLPFPAWKGEVECDPVWIEITAAQE